MNRPHTYAPTINRIKNQLSCMAELCTMPKEARTSFLDSVCASLLAERILYTYNQREAARIIYKRVKLLCQPEPIIIEVIPDAPELIQFRSGLNSAYPEMLIWAKKVCTGSSIHPEDVAQGAAEKGLKNWQMFVPKLDYQHSLTKWLCRIVRNQFMDDLRKAKVRSHENYEDQKHLQTKEREMTRDDVRNLINTLSPLEKSIMNPIMDGYTDKEVSEELGIPLSEIKRIKAESVAKLSNIVKQTNN